MDRHELDPLTEIIHAALLAAAAFLLGMILVLACWVAFLILQGE